jgi:nitric oxide reductase subunit C
MLKKRGGVLLPGISVALLVIAFTVYTGFVYTNLTEIEDAKLMSEEASHGMRVWQQYNCIACHQLFGLGGYLGPDLTNVASDKIKGEQYMKIILKHGTDRMPNLSLSDNEIDALMAFLKCVDKTGEFPNHHAVINWTGNFSIDQGKQE